MDAFLREIKKPKSPRLKMAAETCFVPGTPAADYSTLFAKAEGKRVHPGNVAYEFWCEGKGPSEDGRFVGVIVSGNPPVIEKVVTLSWDW